MVGKSWDYQVTDALGIELDENIAMIGDSVRHARTKVDEVMFDAEHFFDGFKANPEYALRCVRAAYESRRPLGGSVRHQRRHAAA